LLEAAEAGTEAFEAAADAVPLQEIIVFRPPDEVRSRPQMEALCERLRNLRVTPFAATGAPASRTSTQDRGYGRSSISGRRVTTGVRARLYDATGDDREIRLADRAIPRLHDGTLLWVDVEQALAADLDQLVSVLSFPDAIARALTLGSDVPRLVRSDRAVLMTAVSVGRPEDQGEQVVVHIVAMRNAVVTVHDGPAPFLEEFEAEVSDEARLGQLDTATFLGAVIDTMLLQFDRQVEEIEREIDDLDEIALRGDEPDDYLRAVVRLRRQAAELRRILVPQRETLGPLSRPDFELHDELGKSWPALGDRLERTIDGIERTRALLIGSSDIYMGRVAQRSNEVVKRLTVVSTVLLPAVVVAGALGMNFSPPFFDDPNNFWYAVGAMAGLSALILIAARVRRWI
jgi:magnesium transporter